MKPLIEYINEAVDSGILKKIQKFKKELYKVLGSDKFELQTHKGPQPYWDLLIHQEVDMDDIILLDGMIGEMLPAYDYEKYRAQAHKVNDVESMLKKINLEVPENPFLYIRFTSQDFNL